MDFNKFFNTMSRYFNDIGIPISESDVSVLTYALILIMSLYFVKLMAIKAIGLLNFIIFFGIIIYIAFGSEKETLPPPTIDNIIKETKKISNEVVKILPNNVKSINPKELLNKNLINSIKNNEYIK